MVIPKSLHNNNDNPYDHTCAQLRRNIAGNLVSDFIYYVFLPSSHAYAPRSYSLKPYAIWSGRVKRKYSVMWKGWTWSSSTPSPMIHRTAVWSTWKMHRQNHNNFKRFLSFVQFMSARASERAHKSVKFIKFTHTLSCDFLTLHCHHKIAHIIVFLPVK